MGSFLQVPLVFSHVFDISRGSVSVRYKDKEDKFCRPGAKEIEHLGGQIYPLLYYWPFLKKSSRRFTTLSIGSLK